MIVLTLLPFETQCVKVIRRRDKIKVINAYEDFDPIIDALEDGDSEAIINVLRDIISVTKGKREDFYFVLPDTLFQINSEHYEDYKLENKTSYTDFLRSNDIDTENSYFSLPSQMKTNDEWYKSYFVINKKIIDNLILATQSLNLMVKAVEPASIAVMRYLNCWQTQAYILTITKETTDAVFYTPLVGFFKFQLDISGEELKNSDGEEIREIFINALKKMDIYFYQKLKGYVNPNGNVYIIAPEALKRKISRLDENKKIVNTDIQNSYIENGDSYFAIGIGSALKLISDMKEDFYQLPPCFYLQNANLMPDSLLNQNNVIQTKILINRQSKIITAVLIVLVMFQIGAIFNFNSVTIPDEIQSDFNVANAKIKSLEKEEKTISAASEENEKPIDILSNVLIMKPQNKDLGFTQFTITSPKVKTNVDWIKINLISDDSLKIREYVTKLQNNPMFGKINVTEINNNANGAKTAKITIAKPDTKNNNKKDKKNKTEVKTQEEKR